MGIPCGTRMMTLVVGLLCSASHALAVIDVQLVELLAGNPKSPTAMSRSAAVLDLAVEDVNQQYGPLFNFSQYRYDKSVLCQDDQPAIPLAEHFYTTNRTSGVATAIFGPGCDQHASIAGQFATAWNVPMFIPGEGDPIVTNKKRYPTLTRLSPTILEYVTRAAYQALRFLGVNTDVVLFCHQYETDQTLLRACTSLFDSLRLTYNIAATRVYVNLYQPNLGTSFLDRIPKSTKVILIIGDGTVVRPVILAAADKGMTNGDYIFIGFDLNPTEIHFDRTLWSRQRFENRTVGRSTDGRDEDARRAFRALLVISPDIVPHSPEYENFTQRVKQISAQKYDYHYGETEQIHPKTLAYYWSVQLYAMALNQLVLSGGNPPSGRELSKVMWNRTMTFFGQDININSNGDRDVDWSILQLNADTGAFQRVLEWRISNRRTPVIIPPGITWLKLSNNVSSV